MCQYGKSPLLAACEEGYNDTVQMLIDMGVDVNKNDQV